MRFTQWIICLFLATGVLSAQPGIEDRAPVKVSLIHQESSIQPGKPFSVALHYELDQDWHLYWKNPGDTGMAVSVEWNLPKGFEAYPVEWPAPKMYKQDQVVTYGYEKELILITQIKPPDNLEATEFHLSANLKWVACSSEMCLPGMEEVSVTLPVSSESPSLSNHADIFKKAKERLPKQHQVSIQRNGELIEIRLPKEISQPVDLYFCPEENNVISKKYEPVVAKSGDNHVVILKTKKSIKTLNGVLVIKHQDKTEVALALNHPISGNAKEKSDISMVMLPSGEQVLEEGLVSEGFLMAVILAFAGGLILNLMPCVLPVVSLKIMSFVKLGGKDRMKTLKQGCFYALGVLISFWSLAIMLLVLQSYGNAVGWGFQLQNPGFISILIAVIFTFSLSLFGLFEMGTSLQSAAGKAEGSGNALWSGVLATAVATPCTGPFMGTALGIAAGLSAPLSLMVFTSLGLGMASPYLLLSAFPSLLRFLPKPGNWMITFKEVTGFFMLATVLWLLWVFSAQTSSLAVVLLLGSLFIFSLASWIFGKWGTLLHKKATRYTSYVLAVTLFTLGGTVLYISTSLPTADTEIAFNSDWEPYNPNRVAELHEQGIPVFIDFTAKWCLTCQANHMVLTTQSVDKVFSEKGIVKMKADWTSHDPVITEALRQFGRNGVPLYVYFPPQSQPTILPQLLTPDIVIGAITTP